MNYNRRSTRPDGLFYREQRKLRGAARVGRGGMPVSPVKLLAIVAVLLVVVYFAFYFRR